MTPEAEIVHQAVMEYLAAEPHPDPTPEEIAADAARTAERRADIERRVNAMVEENRVTRGKS